MMEVSSQMLPRNFIFKRLNYKRLHRDRNPTGQLGKLGFAAAEFYCLWAQRNKKKEERSPEPRRGESCGSKYLERTVRFFQVPMLGAHFGMPAGQPSGQKAR